MFLYPLPYPPCARFLGIPPKIPGRGLSEEGIVHNINDKVTL